MRASYTLSLLCAGLLACGEPFSNDVFEQDTRFIEAAPQMNIFRLSRGFDGSSFALRAEAPSELYTATRFSLRGVDERVFSLLREIDALVALPPTRRGVDERVWAPPRHPLDPLESRLTIAREGDRLSFTLERRRVAEAWVVLIEGWAEAGAATGGFSFHLDRARALGITPSRGVVEVRFERDEARRRMEIDFTGYQADPDRALYDTQMIFEAHEQGGAMRYAFPGDDELEWIELESHWARSGAGRARAQVRTSEGNLSWEECWGEGFEAIYSKASVDLGADMGEEAACLLDPL